MSENIKPNLTVEVTPPVMKYRCPKCGAKTPESAYFSPQLILTTGADTANPKHTSHCMECYVEWIRNNIPELEEI